MIDTHALRKHIPTHSSKGTQSVEFTQLHSLQHVGTVQRNGTTTEQNLDLLFVSIGCSLFFFFHSLLALSKLLLSQEKARATNIFVTALRSLSPLSLIQMPRISNRTFGARSPVFYPFLALLILSLTTSVFGTFITP